MVRWAVKSDRAWIAYALATALLVLNDHVLKGAGWLPAWITGKLSDFAGVFVAPLTLCVLFGSERRTRRALCFAVPTLLFVATELSADAARALVEAAALTGMSWKLWPDVWDLLALAVLPFAWRLAPVLRAGRASSTTRARLGALLAAVACLGSSVDRTLTARAFVVNRTGSNVEVDVGTLSGQRNCADPVELPHGVLRLADFSGRTRWLLEPNGVLPLDDCGPARLGVGELTSAVDWDGSLPPRDMNLVATRNDLKDEDQLILIKGSAQRPVLHFGSGTRALELAPDTSEIPPSACAAAAEPRLEWSGDVGIGERRITLLEDFGAGCFHLGLVAPDAPAPADPSSSQSLYLCIPEGELPFAVGESIFVTDHALWRDASRSSGISVRAERVWAQASYYRLTRNSDVPLELSPSACGYVREACGAIWRSIDVRLDGVELVVGERRTLPRHGTGVYLGRALHTVIAHPSCGPGFDAPGLWLELVEHYGAQ